MNETKRIVLTDGSVLWVRHREQPVNKRIRNWWLGGWCLPVERPIDIVAIEKVLR